MSETFSEAHDVWIWLPKSILKKKNGIHPEVIVPGMTMAIMVMKIDAMTRTWPRGSEWRKWDLHIHAPGTKLNDQFKADDGDVWKEYCQCLHDSKVQAFWITDYFSADGYFSAHAAFKNCYPDSDKVFFPNIELTGGMRSVLAL